MGQESKDMSDGIYLVGRGRVNKGRVEAAMTALDGVIRNVRANNPGVELYEHSVDPETGVWTGIEKYADSDALKAHITDPAIGAALGRFMADLTFEGITVMGAVSDEVREMMAGFNPTYVGSSIGFTRGADTGGRS